MSDESTGKLVDEGLMSIKEAAAFLGVSRTTIWTLRKTGALPKASILGRRLIPRAAVRQFAARSIKPIK